MTLSGSVNLYQDKLEAAKKIKKVANLSGVRNDIVVAGENVSDSQLQQKLAKKLAYDRVGYRDNAFNYVAVTVKDGVVTLDGATVWDVPKDLALAIVAETPGVKDVVNNVAVLPVAYPDISRMRKSGRARRRQFTATRCWGVMRAIRRVRFGLWWITDT